MAKKRPPEVIDKGETSESGGQKRVIMEERA